MEVRFSNILSSASSLSIFANPKITRELFTKVDSKNTWTVVLKLRVEDGVLD